MKTPCKDCPDREVGCHAICAGYQEFYEQNREKNTAQIKQARMNNYVAEAIHHVKTGRSGSWKNYRKVDDK